MLTSGGFMKAIVLMLGVILAAGMTVSGYGQAMAAEASVKAVNVGNKTCPVSGREIGPDSGMAPATYTYKGKVYNLCCGGCISLFKADPEKYSQIADQAVAQSKEAMKDMPMGR